MDVTVTGGSPPYTFTAVQQAVRGIFSLDLLPELLTVVIHQTESKEITYSTGNFVSRREMNQLPRPS